MEATGRTLHLDGRAMPGPDPVRSLDEALDRLVLDAYDAIVLHSNGAGRDDFGLVDYLAATWPDYLRTVKVHIQPSRLP